MTLLKYSKTFLFEKTVVEEYDYIVAYLMVATLFQLEAIELVNRLLFEENMSLKNFNLFHFIQVFICLFIYLLRHIFLCKNRINLWNYFFLNSCILINSYIFKNGCILKNSYKIN